MHLEAVHFFSRGFCNGYAHVACWPNPTLQAHLTMTPGPSILYPHSTVGLCSPWPIRNVFELTYWGRKACLDI